MKGKGFWIEKKELSRDLRILSSWLCRMEKGERMG